MKSKQGMGVPEELVLAAFAPAARVEFGSQVTGHGSGTLVHSQTHGGVQP